MSIFLLSLNSLNQPIEGLLAWYVSIKNTLQEESFSIFKSKVKQICLQLRFFSRKYLFVKWNLILDPSALFPSLPPSPCVKVRSRGNEDDGISQNREKFLSRLETNMADIKKSSYVMPISVKIMLFFFKFAIYRVHTWLCIVPHFCIKGWTPTGFEELKPLQVD